MENLLEVAALSVSVLVMVITGIALWFTVSSFKKQLQLHFFADYTKRYQEIMLNLPESVHKKDFVLENLDPGEREKILRYMRAYFDLCSEV